MIKIKSCYNWFNVYIDNLLILKHITGNDANDIIKKLHKTNTPYSLDLRG